mgnify:CR=1 FL=1
MIVLTGPPHAIVILLMVAVLFCLLVAALCIDPLAADHKRIGAIQRSGLSRQRWRSVGVRALGAHGYRLPKRREPAELRMLTGKHGSYR